MSAPAMITRDYSLIVGTTAQWVFWRTPNSGPPFLNSNAPISYMRVWNVAPSNGGTIWLSRNGSPAVVNGAGSFPLPPGQYELFTEPQAIPVNALSAISTAASTPLTVEIG